MSAKRRVLAVNDFYSWNEDLRRLATTDPRALYPARVVGGRPFVAKDTKMRSGHPIVLAHPELFAPDDEASLDEAAASSAAPPVQAPGLEEALLPGDLKWSEIAAKYGELAAQRVGYRSRRRRMDQPSRPETAKALGVSTATLKRACKAAGKGTQWPPLGL